MARVIDGDAVKRTLEPCVGKNVQEVTRVNKESTVIISVVVVVWRWVNWNPPFSFLEDLESLGLALVEDCEE